jgi:hypothetical protein
MMALNNPKARMIPATLVTYSIASRVSGTMAGSFLFALGCLLIAACDKPPLLEQIKEQNELVVLTRNNPTTYYEGIDGPTGSSMT